MKGFEYITDVREFGSLLNSLHRVTEVGLDVEASSLSPYEATLLLLQLEVNDLIYILDARKINHKDLIYLIELIKASNLNCIGHNLKYDIKILYHNTGVLLTNIYDTMLGEVLINQGIGSPYYSYVDLVFKYFDVELSKEVRDSFIDFDGEITENQLTYSALDVKYLREIKGIQLKELEEQKQLRVVDLEMKVTPILAMMEYDGVLVDKDLWLENIVIAKKESARLEEEILDTVINTLDRVEFKNTFEVSEALSIPVKTKKLRLELESIAYPFGKTWVRNNFNVNSPYQLKKLFFMLGIYLPDTDAKTLYRGNRIREFNRYINSSDLLQDFIRFLGKNGVKQSEALSIPIELFVNWLILQSAEADGEDVPDEFVPTERHPRLVECKRKKEDRRCLKCGKFIPHNKIQAGFNFCNIKHAQEHLDRLQLAS